MGISTMWNTNSLVQVLNLCHRVYFLPRYIKNASYAGYNRNIFHILNCHLCGTPTHPHICIYIIIIMSCHQHGYPWPSLATPPYCPSLPAGPQGYIPYLHRAAVCRFKLVTLPLLGHVKGSTRIHHLWARPYFSSSVPHVLFV